LHPGERISPLPPASRFPAKPSTSRLPATQHLVVTDAHRFFFYSFANRSVLFTTPFAFRFPADHRDFDTTRPFAWAGAGASRFFTARMLHLFN
jgi:hypothetical protein